MITEDHILRFYKSYLGLGCSSPSASYSRW